jgi:hypothetical protein
MGLPARTRTRRPAGSAHGRLRLLRPWDRADTKLGDEQVRQIRDARNHHDRDISLGLQDLVDHDPIPVANRELGQASGTVIAPPA